MLAIDTAPYLNDPPGPVMTGIRVYLHGDPTPEQHYEPMARMPQPGDLLQLVAGAAASWDRRGRILLVVSVRALDELEARAAWGDK